MKNEAKLILLCHLDSHGPSLHVCNVKLNTCQCQHKCQSNSKLYLGQTRPQLVTIPFVVWRTFWISPQLNIRRIHCSVLNQEHTLMGMFLFTAPNWAASSLLTFLLHTNLAEYLSFPVSLYICHPMCWSWMRTEKEEEWVCRGGITSASKNKKKVLVQMQVTRVVTKTESTLQEIAKKDFLHKWYVPDSEACKVIISEFLQIGIGIMSSRFPLSLKGPIRWWGS